MIALVLRDIFHHLCDIDSATATAALTVHIQSGTGAMDVGRFTVHDSISAPRIALGHELCIPFPPSNHPAIREGQIVALISGTCDLRVGAI